jgi:hypothetical protein
MAVARCKKCGAPKGVKKSYPHVHSAISSNDRIMCGSPSCTRAGSLWLTEEEERQYILGQRTFRLSNGLTGVIVS